MNTLLPAKLLIAAALMSLLTWIAFAQESHRVPSPTEPPAVTHKMSKAEKQKTGAAKGALVDINSASKEELGALPGMNPDLAQKVIDGRPYRRKTDLSRKRLLPANVYTEVENHITVKPPKSK
jgi:DNA uptake protein ComE-like DNA-binding protein